MASSAKAAEPIELQNASFQSIQQQFPFALPGLNQAGVGTDTLRFLNEHTDQNHISHVRMQQEYNGFQVHGGYAIIHSNHSAKTFGFAQNDGKMNGKVFSGLQSELGTPAANFVKNGTKALNKFKAEFNENDISEEEVTPLVYIDKNNKAHWAYKISILVRYDHQIPERPTAIVDAETYKPFVKWNDIKTERIPASGMGYGGNKKSGKINFGKDFPLLEITKEISKCYMENTEVKIVDMDHEYSSTNLPMSFTCKVNKKNPPNTFWTGYRTDGYDRVNGAYSPANDALYAGYVIKHMYEDWYGIQVLTKADGSPMQLVMRVHYGEGYENAYWDGRQMTFGDGEDVMYPLVSLGIGAHEVSHGFTEQHSNLEYREQSGGINESFSDMAAMAAEYYSIGSNTWLLGAEIMKEDSGYEALRYIDKPSRDGRSIDTAADYKSGLDVHLSSGVFNRLYYLISKQKGWDPRKTFDVMVKANMDYWTPTSTFNEAGCGILSATKDHGFAIEGVQQSLTKVGVKYDQCNV